VDPLVEAGQESTSPYGYVFDDPVKLTDPDGRSPDGPGDDDPHHTPPVTQRLATWFSNLFSSDKQTQSEAVGDLAKNLPGNAAIAFTQKDHPTGGDLVGALLDGLSVSGLGAEAKGVSAANKIESRVIGVLDEEAISARSSTSVHAVPESPQGGAYKDLSVGVGEQRHHLVADAISPVSKRAGPSIVMKTTDHILTGSWGSSKEAKAFQARQYEMISQGNFEGALNMGISDVQAKFGTKYNGAIKQAQAYSTKLVKTVKK
jgi:hypothetical protein